MLLDIQHAVPGTEQHTLHSSAEHHAAYTSCCMVLHTHCSHSPAWLLEPRHLLWVQKAATVLPAAQMAAHQAVYGLWVLFSYTSVPTEQAALSFIPQSKPGEPCSWGMV